MNEPNQTTLLCFATSDYIEKWERCVRSHAEYARKFGFSYRQVSVDSETPKWDKFEEAFSILRAGSNVILIDADAEILGKTPSINPLLAESPGKDIFCVLGLSGRPNSGMIIMRAGENSASLVLLDLCLRNRDISVGKTDFVTIDGENGHFIKFLRHHRVRDSVQILPSKWNNTSYPCRQDYIRHYTARMRRFYFARRPWADITLAASLSRKVISSYLKRAAVKIIKIFLRSRFAHRTIGVIVKESRRLERNRTRSQVFDQLMARSDGKVLTGLYRGMKLVPDFSWGVATNPTYVLGSYEKEVQDILERHNWTRNTSIVDVGCANGFHAVGLALYTRHKTVFAYDIDEKALAVTDALAEANGVQLKVNTEREFGDLVDFAAFGSSPFVMIDVEGDEVFLIREVLVFLRGADFLIEYHDRGGDFIKKALSDELGKTHRLVFLSRTGRNAVDYPIIDNWSDDKAWMVLSESRKRSDGWLYCLCDG